MVEDNQMLREPLLLNYIYKQRLAYAELLLNINQPN